MTTYTTIPVFPVSDDFDTGYFGGRAQEALVGADLHGVIGAMTGCPRPSDTDMVESAPTDTCRYSRPASRPVTGSIQCLHVRWPNQGTTPPTVDVVVGRNKLVLSIPIRWVNESHIGVGGGGSFHFLLPYVDTTVKELVFSRDTGYGLWGNYIPAMCLSRVEAYYAGTKGFSR